jgi:hypothetical protein
VRNGGSYTTWFGAFVGLAVFFLGCPAAAQKVDVRQRVPQTSYFLCGVDCLYVCLQLVGADKITLSELEQQLTPGPRGLSMEQLQGWCAGRSVRATAVRTDLESLVIVQNPCILHVNDSHYVVYLGNEGHSQIVFDNSIGLMALPPGAFDKRYTWDGMALVIGTPPPHMIFRHYAVPSLILGAGLAGCACWFVASTRTGRPSSRQYTELGGAPFNAKRVS